MTAVTADRDPGTGRHARTGVVRSARPEAPVRSRRRKEAALAYLLLVPGLALFGVFSFYPFLRNFKLMLYETPPVPGLPAHYVGLHQIVPTITSTQFTQSLVTTLVFVVLVVPDQPDPRAGARRGGAPQAQGHGGLPHDLLLHRGQLGRRRLGRLRHAAQPGGRAAALARHQPEPAGAREHDLGPPVGGRCITIWQFLGLSFIIMSAGLQSVPDELLEAARIDGAGRVDALLAHDGAPAVPDHLLRVGREHDLRLPGLRRRRHPDRRRRTRCACTPTS